MRYVLEQAWLPAGLAADVAVEISGDRFTDIRPGAGPGAGTRLPGLALPGFANAHSHAFHRALRGRTHDRGGSFWTWRARMYGLAERLDPDSYLALARATYAEMSLAGVTAVGEFHYLHHGAGGVPYDNPNAMGEALRQAAAEAGVRLTLLDACYLAGGLEHGGHTPLDPVQRRFSDGSAEAWRSRVEQLRADENCRVGAAIHSVRAVPAGDLAAVDLPGAPRHVHLSEQPAENAACEAFYGRTPTRLLADHGVLGPRTSAVHASHLTEADIALLAGSGTTVCACPSTEADLADGLGPFDQLRWAGVPLSLGSDQHAVIDPLAEARALEHHARLGTLRRGCLRPAELLAAATDHASIGWPDAGRLEVGARADLVTIDLTSPRTAGAAPDQVLLAASASDVRTLISGGRAVVSGAGMCWATSGGCSSRRSRRCGRNSDRDRRRRHRGADDARRDRVLAGAALVVEDGRIAWVGQGSPDADEVVDLGGRAVIPGFVDSHTHLVFAGDRVGEFVARMAGERYDGGGIAATVAATAAASDDELRALLAARIAAARAQGTTTLEVKSGYGLGTDAELRLLRLGGEVTSETTLLGAHVLPRGADPDAYVALVAGEMLTACAPHARWFDVFCEPGIAFDGPQTDALLAAGTAAGLGLRVHAGQLSDGPGIALAVRHGAASVDHCNHLSPADLDALAGSGTVATLLPGADFCARTPYPDARRLLEAGITVALASDGNPGTCHSTSMPWVISLAVRELHLTPSEAIWAATAGGAHALRRTDIGVIQPGALAHLAVIDAPTAAHLAYRPGMPLASSLLL